NCASNFSKETTIAYPAIGLFLDYAGLYTPSETIIHNSAIFPMTISSCNFLSVSAAESVPSCNITRTRHKRLIGSVVSVANGSASLGISLSSSIQIGNLQQQIAVVAKTLSKHSQTVKIHGTQLAKLTSKHIELAEEIKCYTGICR
ncbi:unnamed protein product, partial [Rotaria magnacalcarata]